MSLFHSLIVDGRIVAIDINLLSVFSVYMYQRFYTCSIVNLYLKLRIQEVRSSGSQLPESRLGLLVLALKGFLIDDMGISYLY